MEIEIGGENLVRRLSADDACLAQNPGSPPPTALVRAEGLPNLLHELVHAVQAQRLDDDYGIDYSAIPFDLTTVAGRAVLWDELSCCVVSCAYLQSHGRAARSGGDPYEVRAEVMDWFREQLEIQPVFYGLEDDPSGFVARVGDLLGTHAVEADAILDHAYAATESALQAAGAPTHVAVAPRLRPDALWPALIVADAPGDRA